MHILKFGGTSMGDEHTWRRVLNIIQTYKQPFVIVSATARTTRQLLAAAAKALDDLDEAIDITNEIQNRHQQLIINFLSNFPDDTSDLKNECTVWINHKMNELENNLRDIHETQELTDATKDAIASIGERLSSYLFAKCGNAAGFSTTWINAEELIRTNSDFGQAVPDENVINQKTAHFWQNLDNETIPVMGGYYGSDSNGNTTTLGFEGSDYTASLVGAAISAEAIEIWTDVSGIYTCDPQLIPEAKPIAELSFQEATELAYFGAKVLHPSTTKPASSSQIPIWVKNIFEPEQPGTRISHEAQSDSDIKAITFKENCVVITVTSSHTVMGYEFLSGVFDILRWHHLPVDVVTTTEASISIAIEDGKKIHQAIEQLRSYGSVDLLEEQGIISLVGCAKDKTKSLVHDVLSNIDSSSVKLISFSQSKGNLNIVMQKELIVPSVKAIHRQIFG